MSALKRSKSQCPRAPSINFSELSFDICYLILLYVVLFTYAVTLILSILLQRKWYGLTLRHQHALFWYIFFPIIYDTADELNSEKKKLIGQFFTPYAKYGATKQTNKKRMHF